MEKSHNIIESREALANSPYNGHERTYSLQWHKCLHHLMVCDNSRILLRTFFGCLLFLEDNYNIISIIK